jgi:hypothetical protein
MQSKSSTFFFFISLGRMDRQSLGTVLNCFKCTEFLLINYPGNMEKPMKNACMLHIIFFFFAFV